MHGKMVKQMEKNMKNEMDAGCTCGLYEDRPQGISEAPRSADTLKIIPAIVPICRICLATQTKENTSKAR